MTNISTKRYNLDNFEASFREFLQNEGVSAPTLKNYLSDLRHFMGWFTFYLHSKHSDNPKSDYTELSALASMIDFEAVTSYKMYLESNALPSKTINRRLSTLRKFCTFCIQQNWMKENQAKRVANVGAVEHVIPAKAGIQDDELNRSRVVARDDNASNQRVILAEFKQYLLSEQAKQNVETRHGVSLQKNSDINLALDDVQEFLSICHPA